MRHFQTLLWKFVSPRALAAAIHGENTGSVWLSASDLFPQPDCQSIYSWNFFRSQLVVALIMVASLGYTWSVSSWVNDSGGICGSYDLYGICDPYVRVMDNMSMLSRQWCYDWIYLFSTSLDFLW